jgi:hypothetical protein
LGGTETTWTTKKAGSAPRQEAPASERTITPSTLASSSERSFMLNHQLVESYRVRRGLVDLSTMSYGCTLSDSTCAAFLSQTERD